MTTERNPKAAIVKRLDAGAKELEALEADAAAILSGYGTNAINVAWNAVCLAVDLVTIATPTGDGKT